MPFNGTAKHTSVHHGTITIEKHSNPGASGSVYWGYYMSPGGFA